MQPSSSFCESERSKAAAYRRARANRDFWCMVWSGNGVTYTELQQMDLAKFAECIAAKDLWINEWSKKSGNG